MYKVGDVVKYIEISERAQELRNKLYAFNPPKEGILPGKAVYFDHECTFSRQVFKRNHPENKVVLNPEKAYYIIVDDHNFRYFYPSILMVFTVKPKRWNSPKLDEKTLEASDLRIVNSIVYKEKVLTCGAKIISDESISLRQPIVEKMSQEQKDKISKYISSGDSEMIGLGIKLLLSFDLESNMEEYLVCLAKCKRWYLPLTREFKSVRKRLKSEFPNLQI